MFLSQAIPVQTPANLQPQTNLHMSSQHLPTTYSVHPTITDRQPQRITTLFACDSCAIMHHAPHTMHQKSTITARPPTILLQNKAWRAIEESNPLSCHHAQSLLLNFQATLSLLIIPSLELGALPGGLLCGGIVDVSGWWIDAQ